MAEEKKILIFEDNELNLKLFCDLLQSNGFKTYASPNGLNALELVREVKPDLILMDIQLPEISGFEITKLIKAEDDLRPIPIIAVTAFAMKDDESRILQAGCEDYISKPISIMPFLNKIKEHLGVTT